MSGAMEQSRIAGTPELTQMDLGVRGRACGSSVSFGKSLEMERLTQVEAREIRN